MKYELVLSIYMTVDAGTEDEAFDKAEQATEELFEKDVSALDGMEGFEVGDWFVDWTAA